MRAAAEDVVSLPVGVVTTILTAFGLILAAALTAFVARRSHRDDNIRTDLAAIRAENLTLRERLDKSEERERIRDDYERKLRGRLERAGLEVEPWPDGLTT